MYRELVRMVAVCAVAVGLAVVEAAGDNVTSGAQTTSSLATTATIAPISTGTAAPPWPTLPTGGAPVRLSVTPSLSLTVPLNPDPASLSLIARGVNGVAALAVVAAGPLRGALLPKQPTPVGTTRAMQPLTVLLLAARCMERPTTVADSAVEAAFPLHLPAVVDLSGIVDDSASTQPRLADPSSGLGGNASDAWTAAPGVAPTTMSRARTTTTAVSGVGALAGSCVLAALVVAAAWPAAFVVERRSAQPAPATLNSSDRLHRRLVGLLPVAAFSWLAPGIAMGAATVGVYGAAGAPAYVVCALLLAASIGSVAVMARVLWRSLSLDPRGSRRSSAVGGSSSDATSESDSLSDTEDNVCTDATPEASAFAALWRPWYTVARKPESMVHRLALVVDAATSCAVGALYGTLPSNAPDCGFAFGVAGAFMLLPLFYTLCLRPYAASSDTLAMLAAAVIGCVQAGVASVASTKKSGDGARDQTALSAVAVIALLEYAALLAAPALAAWRRFRKGATQIKAVGEAAEKPRGRRRRRHVDESPLLDAVPRRADGALIDDGFADAGDGGDWGGGDNGVWTLAQAADELPDDAFVPPPPPDQPLPRGEGRWATRHLRRKLRPSPPGASPRRRGNGNGATAELPPWAAGFYTRVPAPPDDDGSDASSKGSSYDHSVL